MDENNEQSFKVPELRPGWEFDIPAELLEIGSKRWTEEQRAKGLHIRCVYPTPPDEKRPVKDAVDEGAGGAVVTYIQARNSMSEIDGVVIPYIEKELVWKALGPNGRQMVGVLEPGATAEQGGRRESSRLVSRLGLTPPGRRGSRQTRRAARSMCGWRSSTTTRRVSSTRAT